MRKLLVFALMLSVAGAAMAIDLGTQAPAKPADNSVYVAPEGAILQGGDTILDAVVIEIPGTWTGTTAGYNNNYDEVCPYTGSTAPEVVYSVTPMADTQVDIDLCYSSYDTKLYVYDENLNLIGCNDDFYFGAPCFTYSSKLENIRCRPASSTTSSSTATARLPAPTRWTSSSSSPASSSARSAPSSRASPR
jgi:hypothetical protein